MSLRVNPNLSTKDRKVYTFDSFKGVDFSTSPYKVAQNRATAAQNLIYEKGTVRKRNGWTSLCQLNGEINGIFAFEIENEDIIIAYAGTRFYRLTWNNTKDRLIPTDITLSSSYGAAKVNASELISQRIQVYINKGKAYIIGCGDYLVYGKYNGKFELRRVFDNEDTYIPTTTINIDKDGVEDENRSSLDKVNILSSYRKNELLGVDENSATWTVDTAIKGVEYPIDDNSEIKIEVYTLDIDGQSISFVVDNRIMDDKTKLYKEGNDIDPVGTVNFATGKITLNINTKPQEDNTANIVVTFKKSTAGQEEFITKGSISTIFGGGGSANRLFISGSNKQKNIHVWSEMYDFAYFADSNYDEIGSDDSSIMGYVRATDGILLVFKEKNGSDASIYYVSGTDESQEDYKGDIEFITKFTKYAGNVSDTIYAKYATASLNGDNLILTKNGVKGLELYDNITTNAYRVRERDRNIRNKLLKQPGLENACAIVFKDKYYLSMDGVVYICDSKFTFAASDDVSGNYNYEWWYYTNVDARVWCEIDNSLFFGTHDGKICKFTEDTYIDLTYQDTEAGDLTVLYNDNYIKYNLNLVQSLNESSNIKFTLGDLFAAFIDSSEEDGEIVGIDEDGYLIIDEASIYKIYQGIECYADRTDDTGLQPNVKYFIGEVDLDNLRFPLLNENGEQVTPTGLGFRLCKNISNKLLYVANVDSVNSTFQLREYASGDILDLVIYDFVMPTQLMATIHFNQNVVAEWYTPICDFGTNAHSKTLFGLSITTEPLIKGKITVGYQTRNVDRDFMTYGTKGFDFNDIDFQDFSFESSFTSSNTIRVKERNFNFIVFRYVSDTSQECAVNGITVRYKINRLNKGVR